MYVGFPFGTDDHMVYSAWMRQAMNGHFFLDNRFTTDTQPGLTVHLYFFVIGLLAKALGIPAASNVSRLFFTGLFVALLFNLTAKLGWKDEVRRLACIMTIFGGGIGFIVWHTFGQVIVNSAPAPISDLLGGLLPIDVWQPEGFVFPSMLTNGLFMVSLCLIVQTFISILDAREGWKPVIIGALSLGVLMNIHSYDALMIGLVMVGFLITAIYQRIATFDWIFKAILIGAGAAPAAIWFVHVLKSDAVFQARAQTDTATANFKAVLFGYILLMIPAIIGLANRTAMDDKTKKRRLAGAALAVLLIGGLYVAAYSSKERYFLDMTGWGISMLLAIVATVLLCDENDSFNLIISWALIGTVAIYFPGLFQRKLTMGLSIPWAILASYGVQSILEKQEQTIRVMVTALVVLLTSATSLRWLSRELLLIKSNASNTSVQALYLDPEVVKIMNYLDKQDGKHVLVAPPGVPSVAFQNHTQEGGTDPITPLIPDLNPIMSGFTGVYTFAGHWSETPNYNKRRTTLTKLFYSHISDHDRKELLHTTHADFMLVIEPNGNLPIPKINHDEIGETVVKGSKYSLIRVK